MRVLQRPVGFEEVDAAGIAFFARFPAWGHEAMEAFFDQIEGGYVGLINDRRIGFPAVRLEADFMAPVRYGDLLRIETTVGHLGNRSATFVYRIKSADRDIALLRHTVVITDLDAMRSTDMPADVRAALQEHSVLENGNEPSPNKPEKPE